MCASQAPHNSKAESDSARLSEQGKAFWTARDAYGALHASASATGARFLIVYVHGILGNCLGTWKHLPETVLTDCGQDCDVFSYDYPAHPWERTAGIEEAAQQLRGWIERREKQLERRYQFIFFVAHSAGGLVVKRLLTDAIKESIAEIDRKAGTDDPIYFKDLPNVITRIRKAIYVCVPHHGGSLVATLFGLYPYIALSTVFGPFLSLIRIATNGTLKWGINRIAWQLCRRSPTTMRLDYDFAQLSKVLKHIGLPDLDCEDLTGLDDVAISFFGPASVLRGNHDSVKHEITKMLAPLLNNYNNSPEELVIDETMSRCWDLDAHLRVHGLVSAADAVTESTRNDGSQKNIFDSLLEDIFIQRGKPSLRTFVLTGEAGVGKSTVIRAIARELALRCRGRTNRLKLLPIVIPLQQVSIPSDWSIIHEGERAEVLLSFLFNYWCTWVNTLISSDVVNIDWLRDWVRVKPSILILDGLDEFFINNPQIDIEVMRRLLEIFGQCLQDSQSVRSHSAILGIRNSYPGHRELASQSRFVFSIQRLSNLQAVTLYPEMKRLLSGISETSTQEVLLTPLILSWLGPRARDLRADVLQNKSVVMQYALDAIIEEGNVRTQLASVSRRFDKTDIKTVLAILGWIFYRDHEGAISVTDVLKRTNELASRWTDQVEGDRDHGILDAFELLSDEVAVGVVLARTVFVSIGSNRWRFAHREWQDFLTANYMAKTYFVANYEEMGQRAMTQAIFQMIAEVLENSPELFEIEESFTAEILKMDGLAAVNLAGIVGNGTRLTIHPRAIKHWLTIDTLDKMDKTARLVLFTGLTYRSMRQAPTDTSVRDIRRAMYDVCRVYGGDSLKHLCRDPITSSLAWCFHRAAAATDKQFDALETNWPALEFKPEHESTALAMLTAGEEHDYRIEARHRSLQVAWLEIVPVVLTNPYRPVSVAHYLYALVVVYRHSMHIPEISRQLPVIFREGSDYEKAFREYTLVPELWVLFQRCRDAFFAAQSSS